MKPELQNQAWACLPEDFKVEIRKEYEYGPDYNSFADDHDRKCASMCIRETFENLFGHHNLTAEEKPQPRFKVGDKVRIIQDGTVNPDYVGIVDEIGSIAPQSIRLKNIDSNWFETCLEPYTAFEPKGTESGEKFGNSENSLNLCELLAGHEGEIFYSPICGDIELKKATNTELIFWLDKDDGCTIEFNAQGKYKIGTLDDYGRYVTFELMPSSELMLFPSAELRSWSEWQKEQKKYHIEVIVNNHDNEGDLTGCA